MTTRTWRSSARRAALGVLLGLGAAAGPAAAQTLIQSCPYTIMTPGTYLLARDLTCPGDGIVVTADNVLLVLDGRTLTGSGSGAGVRAEGTEANPTLEGLQVQGPGTVRGFSDGVHVAEPPGARVVGVTAAGNGDRGIEVRDAPRAQLVLNVATGNANNGIAVADCAGCQIIDNRVNDNGNDGIFAANQNPRAQFARNVATGNGSNGFDVNGCPGCQVVENRADGNESRGFDFGFDTTEAQVVNNTARSNGRTWSKATRPPATARVGSRWSRARSVTDWRATRRRATPRST